MTNPLCVRGIPAPSVDASGCPRIGSLARPLLALAILLLSAPAALAGDGDPVAPAVPAAATPAPAGPAAEQTAKADTPGELGTSRVANIADDSKDEDTKKWSASFGVETSVGFGTFVSGSQNQSAVSTSFSPSFSYEVADKLSLSAAFSLSWYQVLDFATPLEEHAVLMSDIIIGLAHGSIYKHEDSGFNLSGGLALGLPTSLASQFQNRLFSLKPSLTVSIPVGPVKFSYTFGFGKYFNTTATSTVNCDNFDHPDECRQGRKDNPDFGFESERRGPEVYLPGSGSSSFYFQNSLNIRWAIIEGLNLALGVGIYNNFGTRSLPADEFTGEGATAGRAQSDRLVSSLSLSYQVIKQLEVGASLVTATTHPFGDQGNSFVFFDFSRAPDNITSLNFSVTGSL